MADDTTVLKRLWGKPKMRDFLVVDIEATQWVHPYAIGCFDGMEYFQCVNMESFECIRKMLTRLLIPRYARKWIYAHNGGNYDFLFLVRTLLEREFATKYRVELTPAGSCIVRMDVLRLGHNEDCADTECPGCETTRGSEGLQKWSFIDSAKLMPMPLADLGEAFGITKKIKLEMSYDDLAKPENRALMGHYLETDCRSTYQAIETMQRRILDLGGQVGVTLPATSLDLFRRVYQREDIATSRHWGNCPDKGKSPSAAESKCTNLLVNKKTACLHDFIRASYFGGPAQIFRAVFVGKKVMNEAYFGERDDISEEMLNTYDPRFPVAEMYDINSHYPAVMLNQMPVSQAIEAEGMSEEHVYSNARNRMGVVECQVEIPEDCYLPPLPVEHQGKLMFPAGRLFGVWDASELCLLKEVGGRIVKTYRSVWFGTAPVFVDFIREVYKFRDKSKPGWTKGMDWIAKILLNASYGKFAMRELRNRILVHPESPEGMTAIDFDSDVWSEDVHVSPSYVVPQLSVHITALARVKLWKLLSSVVEQGGRIYYTDTDSVVCAGAKLPVGPGLGALKKECTIHRAEFVLPKLYLLETEELSDKKTKERNLRIKSKGMGPGIRTEELGDDPYARELREQEFIDVTRGGIKLERKRLTRLREGLKGYAKSATEFPRIVDAGKQIRSAYDKRVILGDFDTKPLVLHQW